MQLHETCAKCGNADESALLATRGTRLCEKCVAQDTYGRFTKAFAAKGSLLKRGTSRACIALLPRSVSASSLGSSSVSTLFSAAPENALLLEFVRRFTEHNSSNGFNAFDTSGELKGASGGAVGDISGVFRESNAFFVGRPLVICLNVAVLARSPAEKDAIENDCDALRQHATFNLQLDFQCVKLETLFDESKEGTTNNETLSFDPATKLLSLTTASPNSISFSTARQTISLFSSLDAAPSTRKALLDALLLRLATHVVTTTTTQQLHSQHQKQLQHPITQTLIVPLHAAHAAAQVVSLSAIGQGFALPALLASDQQINNNLLIFRPFRDILPDEIAWSVRALKLPVFHALFDAPVFNTDARSGSVSATIQDLAECKKENYIL
ncbi:hypothetical protein HK100_003478 [Physocladia obscura]|uniref:Cytoplasmic tRNA 2-thiolation protein 2 n=1 Tax=Physocladia obscura TaxID=109957 RepID=A0AAD5T001_9FUNG|nr:hypothetical protein HK100_003478 [Physocladia obscura]